MSEVVTYFKGSTSKIRIVLDDTNLRAQGIDTFTLIGSTIITELESDNGDFVKFPDSKVTIVDALTYDIQPDAADVQSLQLGLHDIAGEVTVGANKFGFKLKKKFFMDRLIQT